MYESSLLDEDSMLNWSEISDNNHGTDAASEADTASDADIEAVAITAPEDWTHEVEAYLETPASAAVGAAAMKETTDSDQEDDLSQPAPGEDWFGNQVPVVDEDTGELPIIGGDSGDTPPPTVPPEGPAPFPDEDPDDNQGQPDDQSAEPKVRPTPHTTHILYGPVNIRGRIAGAEVGPDFVPPETETVPPVIFETMVRGQTDPVEEEPAAAEVDDTPAGPVLPEVSAEDEAAARELGSRWSTIMQATQAARALPSTARPQPESQPPSEDEDSAQAQSLEFTLRPAVPETTIPEPQIQQFTEAGLPQRAARDDAVEPAVDQGPETDVLERVAAALRALNTGQDRPEIKQVITDQVVNVTPEEIEAAGGDRLGALGSKLSAMEAAKSDPEDDEDDKETR